ncbi:uncharacterized protein BKCO1_37000162 [Diplodia corticola]|uniref:Uncharacterized protein n=1 Tax=Diplodia corticola TaxID=236234 RepID=A0A1J9QW89_9PEZI|nr:uncharacterized protein BKCO1_37000162 [Diplodia corticola]OJD32649.1 hypothetical protein BKCO1_37000162 [Diplodia corticola]
MQRQEPHPQPPPPPRPRPQYQTDQHHAQNRESHKSRRDKQHQLYHQCQQHLQSQQQQPLQPQHQLPYSTPEYPQKRREKPIISPSRSPAQSKPMPSPSNDPNFSYSSLMRGQNTWEHEAGNEDIQIDEEWIERNGAFACIWALTYKLPTKESEEMAMMTPPGRRKKA